jgi:hypothetical protein
VIDKSEIREILLHRREPLIENSDLIMKLESLSIFNTGSQFDMESLYDNIVDIISWQTINSLPSYIKNEQTPEVINTILNIQSWAIHSWEKGLETADLNKIIISYILVERLYLLPEKDLNWDVPNENLKNYLDKFLPTIVFDVNKDMPKYASYSDKKFQKDYEEALKNNNYRGIMLFLTALDRGNHFSNDFVKILVKISIHIDPSLLAVNVCQYTPFLIKLIFNYMKEDQIIALLDLYQNKNPLPLLIGLIQIINPTGNNQFDEEILLNYNLIESASKIVEKIAIHVETDNIYRFITNCSNIDSNNLWHSIFSAFIAKEFKYYNQYINEIIFTHDTGENSFNSFSELCINKSDLDIISLEVYNKYLICLSNEKTYHQNLFCFTSYYKYIFHAINVLSDKTFNKYLEILEIVSIELKRGIYSWNHQELTMLFTKWIFWIIKSKEFDHENEINKDILKTTFELLNDKRILNALSFRIKDIKIDFAGLIDFLTNPESISCFTLPYKDSAIELGWNNTIVD